MNIYCCFYYCCVISIATFLAPVTPSAPRALLLGRYVTADHKSYLEEVDHVLRRLGYEITFQIPDGGISQFDLIWTHDWPFHRRQFSAINPPQRINHFRNLTGITNKVDLATLGNDHVPPAFRMPEQYEEWLGMARSKPSLRWLNKANTHRGITLIDDVTKFKPHGGNFVQMFIENPLLIDNFKFDIGVHVLITSQYPLRYHILDDSLWIRACSKPYHPFDATKVAKYVIDSDHITAMQLPSLSSFIESGMTLKQALVKYLTSRGYDASNTFHQVERVIDQVLRNMRVQERSNGNHFELVRFDFIIEKLNWKSVKLWLMEVNFSPNLWSKRWPQARPIYRKILFDVFSILNDEK